MCLCVFADPVRKISEVSMWVECGEWRRQDENRRLTHESDAPKRGSGSRVWQRVVIGLGRDTTTVMLFFSEREGQSNGRIPSKKFDEMYVWMGLPCF